MSEMGFGKNERGKKATIEKCCNRQLYLQGCNEG